MANATTTKKATTETKVVEETKKTTVDKTVEENKELKSNLSSMQKQMEEMQKLIISLSANSVSTTKEDTTISSDDEIPVISQCIGELTLSTEPFGNGTLYEFKGFGEIVDIPFGDLKGIVKSNKFSVERGDFYIANEDVVSKLRLKAQYQRMLSNEDINTLFTKDASTIVELYKLAPDGQKENIIAMVQAKRLNGETIDANVLTNLGELSGKNLISIEPLEQIKK